jgi:uncharacterized membrane protein
MEFLLGALAILLLTIAVLGPIVALVLAVVLFRRTAALRRRVECLEAERAAARAVGRELGPRPVEAAPQEVRPAAPLEAEIVAEVVPPAAVPVPPPRPAVNWELLIGRKGLGWVAVILLLFGTAFFLRYAYENQWIGPLGRVAVGLIAGVALILAGWRYDVRQWRIFSQMLSSAGIVVLFLAVYSAFGFYRLVPQQVAAGFLLAVIAEAALLAALYNAPSLAWMSLIGGLLIPVLMRSDTDQYQSLFTYLTALNVGFVLLAGSRHWFGLGTAALLGTQGLFWLWHWDNYHPEKLPWAIGFQLAIYVLFVLYGLAAHVLRRWPASWEDLARLLLNASLWFLAAYVLLREDYRDWLGLLAVSMATVYVLLARGVLWRRPEDARQLLTTLAAAVGFIALAFPIQADAEWVALGWAAEAAALSWFGLRTRAVALRGMAAGLMALAVMRMVLKLIVTRVAALHAIEPYIPIFNEVAVPALGVTACLLGSVVLARRFWPQIGGAEKVLVALAGMTGILVLWFVLSVDTHGYFIAEGRARVQELTRWRWLGQMALSALWGFYAMAVLAIGFARRIPPLRWTALVIFALTIGKVFLFDMAGLKEFYRILAFFIVAILLGVAGWAYQRIQVDRQTLETMGNEGEQPEA